MQNPELQLLLHGENIGGSEVRLSTDEIGINRIVRPANANYLILYLDLQHARPQTFKITLRNGREKTVIPYELRERSKAPRTTWDASDVVYLLMPDRFADGDASNNIVSGLREQECSVTEPDARHGGDFAGIVQHLIISPISE